MILTSLISHESRKLAGTCLTIDDPLHTLCAKFVSVFMPTMVLKMIKDVRRFPKGFGTSFPMAQAIQRWKATVAGLLLYVFPLRNSTVALVSPKETSSASVFEDVVIFKFNDSNCDPFPVV
jgi:hypothetical protein